MGNSGSKWHRDANTNSLCTCTRRCQQAGAFHYVCVCEYANFADCVVRHIQAIWFLNGFWSDGIEGSAENIWAWYKHAVALDMMQQPPKGEAGNELDPFWSAKFLEDQEEALTAVERKAAMQEIDVDNNGKMALIEYLCVSAPLRTLHSVWVPTGV